MTPAEDSTTRAKSVARQAACAARTGCDPALGIHLARHVLASAAIPPGAAVGGFWPLAEEIDVRPLLLGLLERGHAILLPQTPPRGNPLIFRHWRPGTTMVAERFGTQRPDAPAGVPDLLLVPLLAFDRQGRRLGYGAGYYDRTIAELPGVRTIGCAFAAQEVEAVPVGPLDARLDAVATERGLISIRT